MSTDHRFLALQKRVSISAKLLLTYVEKLCSDKRHIADALGNPVRLILTAGHVHDVRAAGQLLEGVACGALLGDKSYDADALVWTSAQSLLRGGQEDIGLSHLAFLTPPASPLHP
jgi:hypothetical protein